MAAYFWVTGGTGNWNSASNWALSSGGVGGIAVPGSGDTAAIDANSGSGTVTLDISPTIQTLTCTGFTGTLAFGTNTISLNSTGTIFTGATTMAVTGTPLIICTNSSATARTITPTAVTEANSISFRITSGTGTLTTTAGSYRDLDFTDGTNPTGYAGAINNNAITIYGDYKASTGMSATGSNALTFAATSGTKTITTAAVVFDRPFTFNGVGGSWQLQDPLTSGATRTCTLTNGTLDLNGYTLTTGLFSSNNSNTRTLAFGTSKIVLNGTSGTIFTTSTATGLTVTGTAPLIQATAGGAGTRTINLGAAGEANAISLDVTAGSDIISLSTTSGAYKNVDFTGFTGTVSIQNSILVFGNWNYGGTTIQGTGTGTVTFSATSGTKTITSNGFSFPSNVTFNGIGGTWQLQNALTLGSTRTCTLTNGTLDLNNYTLTTGIFSSSNSNLRSILFVNNVIVVTGLNTTVHNTSSSTNLTLTGSKQIQVTGVGLAAQTRTISSGATSSGGTEATAFNFVIASGADAIDLGTTNSVFGKIQFNPGFTGNIAANAFLEIYDTLTLSSGMTVTGGTNAWVFKTNTLSAFIPTITTNNVTINNPITFDAIAGTWEFVDGLTLGLTQPLTLTNGTLKLAPGTNTVGSLVTTGTNPKFLQSTTPGTQATISAASGTNTVSYLTIQDSNATGGAIFDALAITNVNAGNNTGWLFSTTPSIGNEITMRLRSFTQPRRF